MPVTTDSPIADLGLPKRLADDLTRKGHKTIGALTRHTAAYFADTMRFRNGDMAALTEALAAHGLEFAKPIGDWNRCGTCPTCPDCGNPRAQTANAVGTGLDGRAKHLGGAAGPVCDGCHAHHSELVASRARELAGLPL